MSEQRGSSSVGLLIEQATSLSQHSHRTCSVDSGANPRRGLQSHLDMRVNYHQQSLLDVADRINILSFLYWIN